MAAPLVQLTPPSPRAPAAPAAPLRKPAWLRVQAPGGPNYLALKHLMRDLQLHTVCEEAHCPNIGECWEHRAATFMILGDVCTRNCAYCAVAHGTPRPLDPGEPARLAEAVARMGLKHVVITSVDRDDLPHGGAETFAACVAEIRRRLPETSVEVLIPDFKGSEAALRIAVAARPDILNHNLETIERLYRLARPGGRYSRALELLRRAKELDPGLLTKSGIICGLGEEWDELLAAMQDLRAQRVDILTLGQYLRPSAAHLPITRYYTPDEFGEIGGFCHLYIGQEAVAAGSLAVLRDDDYVICSYREHGQALVRGVPANAVMAELFGKATGCSRGKGGSMHLFDAGRRFMGGHGIVGGHIPLAAGLGFAIKYRGGDQICLCYFGEAAVNIGAFHEALNMASVWKLPIIFLCENNRYGMGTAFERVAAVTDVVEHACSYDMAAELVNGMDVLAVYEATRRAAERARKGGHPTLLEVRTYRFMGHSMSDPLHGVYRTKEEVEEQRKRDPISQLAGKLKEEGVLDEAGLDALDAEVRAETEEAVRFADQSPDPDPAELTTHVLAE